LDANNEGGFERPATVPQDVVGERGLSTGSEVKFEMMLHRRACLAAADKPEWEPIVARKMEGRPSHPSEYCNQDEG
jgi:hypothetical protein